MLSNKARMGGKGNICMTSEMQYICTCREGIWASSTSPIYLLFLIWTFACCHGQISIRNILFHKHWMTYFPTITVHSQFFRLHIRRWRSRIEVKILAGSLFVHCKVLLGDSREVTSCITSKFCDDEKDIFIYIVYNFQLNSHDET